MFKEVQEEDDLSESPTQMQGETPDLILEHGKTRLTLDLDGWEWFWLFLTIIFVSSLWVWLSNI
tara:strand:+ start:234 stop:425 length:192 start_codon:yes stop_codon:yes gene_type:complete